MARKNIDLNLFLKSINQKNKKIVFSIYEEKIATFKSQKTIISKFHALCVFNHTHPFGEANKKN